MNEEAVNGERHYLEALQLVHTALNPDLYMEIGVRNSDSLRLAKGSAVGIDPVKQFEQKLPESTLFYEMTSDDFFSAASRSDINEKVDFSFIDGMHLFEYALRDFINIESYSVPWTLVAFDDIFPNHPSQALRDRKTTVWTGDVWKLRECLKRYRPDLVQITLNTWPSGLLFVFGLDSNNSVLVDNYEKIIAEFSAEAETVPQAVIGRVGAMPPSNELIESVCAMVAKVRGADDPAAEMRKLRKLLEWRGV